MNIEVGYVGNSSKNLMNFDVANYNAVPLNAMLGDPNGNGQAYRPLPEFGDLNVYRHSSYQNYHGLQTLLARQRGNFNFTLAYTFSKALGILGNTGGTGGGPVPGSEYVLDPVQSSLRHLELRPHARGDGVLQLDAPRPEGADRPRRFSEAGRWPASRATSAARLYRTASGSVNFNMQGTLAEGLPSRTRSSRARRRSPPSRCSPAIRRPACRAGTCSTPRASRRLAGRQRQLHDALHEGPVVLQQRPVALQELQLGGDKKLQLRVSAYNVLNHPIAIPTPGRT